MGVIYHTFILYPAASSLKVVLSTDAPREAAAGLVFFSTDRSVRSQASGRYSRRAIARRGQRLIVYLLKDRAQVGYYPSSASGGSCRWP